ncbi:hypothetical protein [Ferrimonas aestuarii]|uniref:Terminase small subunit n=1 Tax=Ferrimonas aestuarii TaxID=2569539 RepID=A0A4U1BSN0_9GAMM|nr:hypothetical protein [Ferrimonas aestuarii]TKB58370.1 hypothetical protein FCL42_01065 [Ferrimonas aestuarii]
MDRDNNGQFLKGNTSAKAKRGYKDRGRQLARMFTDDDITQVYQALMANAVAGDTASIALISRYIAPAPKSTYAPTPFDYDATDPLKGAESIMNAIANGQLPADVGRSLLEGVGTVQRIKEMAELEVRLKQLEQKLEDEL